MVLGQDNKNPQEESIYNLIPRTEIRASKTSQYVSKFHGNVCQAFKNGKYEHRTMGYAEEPIPDPQRFLKKHQHDANQIASNDPKERSSSKECSRRRPPVPTVRDIPKVAAPTEKNFIQINALDVALIVPKRPERNIVDNRFGDKFPIDPSGLAPKYILKKNFGEVPVYIKTRQVDVEKAKQAHQAYASEHFGYDGMREMDGNERQTILDNLKKQWEEVHIEYQKISVTVDTISKRKYKERLERQMKAFEKDIDLLQKHKVIYITD